MSQGNASFASRNMVWCVPPESLNGSAVSSAYIPMSNYPRITALITVGATAGTLNAKFEQATDGSGTGVKDVTGAAITQLSGTDDDTHAVIDLEASKMDIANDFTYVRLTITAGSTAEVAAFMLAPTRHMPPTLTAEEVVVVAG